GWRARAEYCAAASAHARDLAARLRAETEFAHEQYTEELHQVATDFVHCTLAELGLWGCASSNARCYAKRAEAFADAIDSSPPPSTWLALEWSVDTVRSRCHSARVEAELVAAQSRAAGYSWMASIF